MTSIKIKFRTSIVIGKQGTIYYQITHNRVTRQQKTGFSLYPEE